MSLPTIFGLPWMNCTDASPLTSGANLAFAAASADDAGVAGVGLAVCAETRVRRRASTQERRQARTHNGSWTTSREAASPQQLPAERMRLS